jgi:hypothetical protein
MPKVIAIAGVAAFVVFGFAFHTWANSRPTRVEFVSSRISGASTTALAEATASVPLLPEPRIVRHLPTPEPLKAIYMTSCVASHHSWREELVNFIDTTELNAVVIDIKDYSGKISFETNDPRFPLDTKGCYVPDMKAFLEMLHEKGIYIIGRVTVMQDATYPKTHPDAAVKRKSTGEIWKDKKGITFVDPGATEYWEYIVDLAKAAHAIGFDEINFDYIRYPSDGNMTDIAFPRTGTSTKSEMMRKFYAYIGAEMKKAGIISSADLFGMTTTNTDDLNIGQIIEHALLYFDYVAPMVYPSHFPPTFNGWKNPNDVPGQVVEYAMKAGVARANALEKEVAIEEGKYPAVASTSTPNFVPSGKYANKLRPWIQDFDYGGDYDENDVRAQKEAVYAAGLTSWMVWDPGNRYTKSAFDKE